MMVAIDTSALIAIALGEPVGEACEKVLWSADKLVMSAGTLAEALIVANHRGFSDTLMSLVDGFDIEIVPVSKAAAQRVAQAHLRWGRGRHRAALNFGDCFAYDVATSRGCSLLFVGDDFSPTDVASAL